MPEWPWHLASKPLLGALGRSDNPLSTALTSCAPELDSAILDRVLHHVDTVVIEGKSFRTKKEIDE